MNLHQGWNIDFSLALHNRTGKYYIGRDLILAHSDLIERVYYWRVAAPSPPDGMSARVLGRLLSIEHETRIAQPSLRAGLFRSKRPIVHLDPATVIHSRVSAEDIVVCHDMGPVTHPELFSPKVSELYVRAFDEIVRARARLVCVSQATLDTFRGLYGDLPDQRVIYPAIRCEVHAEADEPVPGVGGRFFLTVGNIGRRKNQLNSIAAFERSGLVTKGWSYVLCGGREPGHEAVAERAARTAGVTLLSYVSDAQLNRLYRRAEGFVLTSQLEGFGIPIAEAVAHGLIPLVSRGTVLEEVAGPGAFTADCRDIDSIADGLRALAEADDVERSRRRSALAARATRFTPQAFADDWRRVLEDR